MSSRYEGKPSPYHPAAGFHSRSPQCGTASRTTLSRKRGNIPAAPRPTNLGDAKVDDHEAAVHHLDTDPANVPMLLTASVIHRMPGCVIVAEISNIACLVFPTDILGYSRLCPPLDRSEAMTPRHETRRPESPALE